MLVLAALPALAARFRALALAAATLAAVELAVGLSPHRFWKGFVGFYDFSVPFDPRYHPLMHGDIELAVFGFAAAAGLALAGRRRLVAVLVLLVGAGWPATLAGGGGQLLLGGLILAGALVLLTERAPREALAAAALVVVAGTAAASSPALAKEQLLGWQHWDIRRPSTAGVSVAFAWNADYTGTRFPKRATKVFTVAAPPDSRYWRATTLDIFSGDRWLEGALPWIPGRSRVDFAADELAPAGARDQRAWVRQEVTIAALGDSHLLAASEPVAFDAGRNVQIQYAGGGNALVAGRLPRGSRYTAWSYAADPAPDALARSPARYPAAVFSQGYLDFQGGVRFPSFGAAGRAAIVRAEAGQYAPLYARAKRVAAGARSPYAAALQLEEWFRSGGGFRYDEQPPRAAGVPPLVGFVLDTRRGYCQHYAGAMALMLRMLGVPARVAVGFRTGVYDDKTGVWTVTDRDAHAWVEAWFAGYGWLPFDPTPGRGRLEASYSAASAGFDAAAILRAIASGVGGQSAFERKLDRQSADGADAGLSTRGSGADLPGNGGHVGPSTPGRDGLLRLVGLVLAVLFAAIVVAKAVVRRWRYVGRGAREIATACRQELADVLRDQGVEVGPSTTPAELGALVEEWAGVSGEAFAAALERARFGPAAQAHDAAGRARAELRALRRALRRELPLVTRARGLLSLRSLGFS